MSLWKRWERECARRLTDAGLPADRQLEETREGNLGDLKFHDAAPFVVQCRDYKAPGPSAWKALADARAAADPGQAPVALCRVRYGRGTKSLRVAVMYPRDVFELSIQADGGFTRLPYDSPKWSPYTALRNAVSKGEDFAVIRRKGEAIAAMPADSFYALVESAYNPDER